MIDRPDLCLLQSSGFENKQVLQVDVILIIWSTTRGTLMCFWDIYVLKLVL